MKTLDGQKYTKKRRIADLQAKEQRLCREMSIAWKALFCIAHSNEPKSAAMAKAALDQLSTL